MERRDVLRFLAGAIALPSITYMALTARAAAYAVEAMKRSEL